MEQIEDVVHLNCTVVVTEDNLNSHELFKVLKHVKPTWNPDDLICKELSGGRINLILRCYMNSNPEDSVAFRIWSQKATDNMGDIINRNQELELINKLGQKGVGPKLFASFDNGVCFEYFDGEKLTPDLCLTDAVAKSIAKNFASFHGTQVESFSPEVECFQIIYSVYNEFFPFKHCDPEKDKVLQTIVPSKEQMVKEIEFLKEYLKGLNSPIVMCHGDSHAYNMLHNKTTGRVILVDYEGSFTGYQPTDLAAFLLALTADYSDFSSRGYQLDLLPDEEYQRKFLRWYLEEWFQINGKKADDVTEMDVTKLFIQVNKYFLFIFFYSSMFFLKFCALEDNFIKGGKTDWCRLALMHLTTYFKKKEYFTSLEIPE